LKWWIEEYPADFIESAERALYRPDLDAIAKTKAVGLENIAFYGFAPLVGSPSGEWINLFILLKHGLSFTVVFRHTELKKLINRMKKIEYAEKKE